MLTDGLNKCLGWDCRSHLLMARVYLLYLYRFFLSPDQTGVVVKQGGTITT
jgi:hypothetical protein